MEEKNHGKYTAIVSRDARFDGHFFVGVASTGIYCRPVCSARKPKEENCTFYESAAEAEHAGFRPCLICRPELAPGSAPVDASATLAQLGAKLLKESCGNGLRIADVAEELGCTDRHLRRTFLAELHVTPVQYLQTCRLLLAKSLLTDTGLSVTKVAMASGFGSLRRFNEVFKKQYGLTPTDLRKRIPVGSEETSSLTVTLGYRPPYLWQEMLDFLALRAIPGVEKIEKGKYFRVLRLKKEDGTDIFGWVEVEHQEKKHALQVTVDEALLPVLPQVLARVRDVFDLDCDPESVYQVLASMREIAPQLPMMGLRVPGSFDFFEMAVRAVLGQQITVKAAITIAGRMAKAFGTPVATGIEGLNCAFPAPEAILNLPDPIANHLGPLGVIRSRAKAIQALAEAIVQGNLSCVQVTQPEVAVQHLKEVTGVGEWTAQYVTMRGTSWPDAFPHTDLVIKKALAPLEPNEILALAEKWRPWRSYAAINLWQ